MISDGSDEVPPIARSENHPLLIRAIQAFNVPFCRWYHGLRILSPRTLPASGAAILICNHTSGLDPLLLQSACPRLITWLIAREYYEQPLLKPILRRANLIPTSRNGRDMAALRGALRTLEEGRILGIFPEGRIETERALLPLHPGAAMLALRSGAMVYSAWLDGSQRGRSMTAAYLLPSRATLRFGPPLQLPLEPEPTRPVLAQAAERMRQAIQALGD